MAAAAMAAAGVALDVHQPADAHGASMLWCLGMSLLAGLSTTLGAAVVFLLPGRQPTPSQMAFTLSLAAGVMLSVTLLEFWLPILSGGRDPGPVVFFSLLGAAAFLALSFVVPEADMEGISSGAADVEHGCAEKAVKGVGSHEHSIFGRARDDARYAEKNSDAEESGDTDLLRRTRGARLAFVLMLSLTAHNFPEGFAVAISANQDKRTGLLVMFAIAVHNIPEGIAIAVPVLAATDSKYRALMMSLLSGMAEPVGAASALLMLRFGGGLGEKGMDNLLCVVGGTMCAVAAKELLPEALRQGDILTVTGGVGLGFLIMAMTSWLGA